MKETQMLQVQAYDYLINIIKRGELKTDTIYSLTQMAKDLGLSKTPLRDAVLRLEQERYIDIYPSKGFMLHKMTPEDIVETYQIRDAIEGYCFKQLALHIETERGQKYYLKLINKIKRQKEIIETTQSSEEFARKDYEFHRSVVQYVGNESMLEIYRQFMYRIFWLNVTSFTKSGRMKDTLKEHQNLLQKIKKQDSLGLETQLNQHLIVAQDINLTMIESPINSI
ncbi:MAG: GntR family transcriptional regulator [Eubacteriaceae bacterium]